MPNLPKDVERYVQEGLDAGMDESKAWAIAWSRFCKYKNPDSTHCKQDEYFHGKGVEKKAFQTWDSQHESPAGVRYPKSDWDSAIRSSAVFRWATPASRMDGTFPEPWRVADKDAALKLLQKIAPTGCDDLYVDYESDLYRGRLQLWVGLRDNRDRAGHDSRLAELSGVLLDAGYPVRHEPGRLWLVDDIEKSVLQTKRASAESETWALVSPDGYLFGIADMPNAKSKSYWRHWVDDDHVDEAELVKLVNLPPNLHDRVQKNDFDDGYDAWGAVQRYKNGPAKRLANKVVTTIKGQLPQQRDPAAREMALNPPSGGGKHKNKQDYQRGKARNPKHRKPLDREASQPLSLQRDYGSLREAWGDTIYDA